MNNKLDIVSGSHHHQENTVTKFNTWVTEFQLTDIWRQQHPEEKNFTWSRRNPLIARRLDNIFLGENLISHATDSNNKSIGFSDHRPIFATLNFTTFEHGPSTYKLNVSLLNDPAYIEVVNEYLDNALDKFADLDPHQRWEMIKIEIKKSADNMIKEEDKNVCDQPLVEAETPHPHRAQINEKHLFPRNGRHFYRILRIFLEQVRNLSDGIILLSFEKSHLTLSPKKGMIILLHKGKELPREDLGTGALYH
ncbi:Pol-like protein [Elysia marginata]|uniref:Pol-like protein n=1 Tax=Elysia marginata TaxID=1093978 RepID=A0AAV4I7X3_9GAST|nr:Pol-like protein [Elysia marginata]